MTLRIRNEAEFRQLQIGDLVTREDIRAAFKSQQRKRANKAKKKPNDIFAEQLKEAGIAHVREYQITAYHLTEKRQQQAYWHMDFAIMELEPMFFVEIQGGIWRRGGGAHSHPLDILRNMHKQNDAQRRGFLVYQYTSDEVKNGEALNHLLQVMADKGWRART